MTTPTNDTEKTLCNELNADGVARCQNYLATCPYRGSGPGGHRRVAASGPAPKAPLSAPVVALCGPAAEHEIEVEIDELTDFGVTVDYQSTFDDTASAAARAYDTACAAFASAQVRGAQAKTATNAATAAHADASFVAQRAHAALDNVRGAAEAALLPGHEADALIADTTRRAADADHDVAQAREALIKAAVREHRTDKATDAAADAMSSTRERADEAAGCAQAHARHKAAWRNASQELFDTIQEHMREVNG